MNYKSESESITEWQLQLAQTVHLGEKINSNQMMDEDDNNNNNNDDEFKNIVATAAALCDTFIECYCDETQGYFSTLSRININFEQNNRKH